MALEPGKLYKVNQYFWLLFPTEKTAVILPRRTSAAGLAGATRGHADDWASYWSKELNCTVSFLNEGDTFMVVEVSGEQVKVINQEGKSGWINFPFEEQWTAGAIVKASYDL